MTEIILPSLRFAQKIILKSSFPFESNLTTNWALIMETSMQLCMKHFEINGKFLTKTYSTYIHLLTIAVFMERAGCHRNIHWLILFFWFCNFKLMSLLP